MNAGAISPCATAYGLNFRLPFACPEMSPADGDAAPDVTVVDGPVPRHLGEAAIRGDGFEAEPGRFLLRAGRRAGRFLIEDGTRITLQRGPVSEDPILAFQFLHSVMAALLHQRGYLVLHGGAALLRGGVTVISGNSGAGKSTMLAELATRGHPMLSDDVTALRVGPDGEIEVIPGPAWIHLCDDAARRFSTETARLARHSWHRMKVAVQMRRETAAGPLPFRRWAALAIWPGEEVRVRYLSGVEKLAAFQSSIFVPMALAEHAERFGVLHAVMERVPLLAIERPAGQRTLSRVVEAVLHG